jgi:hypothetical protein
MGFTATESPYFTDSHCKLVKLQATSGRPPNPFTGGRRAARHQVGEVEK